MAYRFIFLLLFMGPFITTAQKENNVWVLGRYAGLDFNSGLPVPIQTTTGVFMPFPPSTLNSARSLAGFASVSDRHSGELLFYTDSRMLYDHTHNVMPGSVIDTIILPGGGYTFSSAMFGAGAHIHSGTSSVIIPFVGDTNRFFLFTRAAQDIGIYYSVVDMSLNGGMGDIDPNYRIQVFDSSQRIISMCVAQGVGCEMWLITYSKAVFDNTGSLIIDSAFFKAYRITVNGVDMNPVVSPGSGPLAFSGNWSITGFNLSMSPDSRLLTFSSRVANGYIETSNNCGASLFRFDPATGIIDNELSLVTGRSCSNAAFSPDETKLYLGEKRALANYNTSGTLAIVQFDVRNYNPGAVQGSRVAIDSSYWQGLPGIVMRRMNDKIYIGGYTQTTGGYTEHIHRINNPDVAGALCDLEFNAVPPSLPGTAYTADLGVDVLYPKSIEKIVMDTVICTRNGAAEILTLVAPTGYPAYAWDDGRTDQVRAVSDPGTYWVRYKTPCHWDTDTFVIHYTDISFTLPEDTLLCNGAHLSLQAEVPGADLLWQDGSKGNQYTVTQSGMYWLNVSKGICAYTDTVNVTIMPAYPQFLGNDTTYCNMDGILLMLDVNPFPGAKVQWSTGSTEDQIVVRDSGVYWVRVIAPPCPAETDTIRIVEEMCGCSINVPAAFTPNGDGRNDMFRPVVTRGCLIQGYSLQVFNRWGERVYQSGNSGVVEGWDGIYKGQPAELGTYYYRLRLEAGTERKEYKRQGDLTLVR